MTIEALNQLYQFRPDRLGILVVCLQGLRSLFGQTSQIMKENEAGSLRIQRGRCKLRLRSEVPGVRR